MAGEDSPPSTPTQRQSGASQPTFPTESEIHQPQAQGSSSSKDFHIRLRINSPGGALMPCLAIYDVMTRLKKQVVIATSCFGEAHGTASLLLSAGTDGFRYSGAHSLISLRVSEQQLGNYRSSSMVQAGKELDSVNATINDVYQMNYQSKSTSKENERRKKLVVEELEKKRFRIFTADEARYYGLVDHILPHP